MKEYCIYIKCKNGEPYILSFYSNILNAKQKLFEMIQIEEDRGRPYFVDNDFFKNKYILSSNLKYYCIKEREVSDFKKYSEEATTKEENNKIIYFQNFKKTY